MSFLEALHSAHHRPKTRIYFWVQSLVWLLIVTSVLSFLVELLYPLSAQTKLYLAYFDTTVLVAFGAEVVLKILSYQPPELSVFTGNASWRLRIHLRSRLRYLLQPLILIDLLTVLSFSPALRGLRALRLLRLLSGVRFFRYSNPILGVFRALGESWLLYANSLGGLLLVVFIGGANMFLLENAHNDSINSLGDGIWWAFVTITTVGYGDISPVTDGGRATAGVVMVLGMFALALIAGIVSTTLLNVMVRLREEQFRMSNHVNHVVICGFHPSADTLLQAMLEEMGSEQRELIIFAQGERPPQLPAEFSWVSGDPTKESELEKIRLSAADSVLVMGRRDSSPQQADATTLLTLFTLRSYLKHHQADKKRLRALHIVAEILDHENVAHAYTAGANEVIETPRLGYAMMAHSIQAKGSGEILSQVASSSAASIYLGRAPNLETVTFGELAALIKSKYGGTLLGLRAPESGAVELNPAADLAIVPGSEIVYLAEKKVLDAV